MFLTLTLLLEFTDSECGLRSDVLLHFVDIWQVPMMDGFRIPQPSTSGMEIPCTDSVKERKMVVIRHLKTRSAAELA